MKCENCGNEINNFLCIQCGHYNKKIGLDQNDEQSENNCPECNSGLFDGWNCPDCNYKISDKAKKVMGEY